MTPQGRRQGGGVALGRFLTSFLTAVLLFVMIVGAPVARASTPGVPTGIVAYVPITITNLQTSATPAPFQQMVQIDSATYSYYEAPDLSNVEFFSATGAIVPSWMESGNNNAATVTTYWLNIADGIPASSSVTVYMGFASLTTNLFGGRTGEAPRLSPQYGQYDSGKAIFQLYDNFAGSSLDPSAWSVKGSISYTVSNGFSSDGANTPNNNYGVFSVDEFSPGSIAEFNGTLDLTNVGRYADVGVMNSNQFSYSIFQQPGNGEIYGLTSYSGGCCQFSTGSYGFVPLTGTFGIDLVNATTTTFQLNYGNSQTLTTDKAMAYPSSVVLMTAGGVFSGSFAYNWVRVRSAPPNGVMPSAVLGSIVPPAASSTSISCTPLQIAAGSSAICTVTVKGVIPTGTVSFASLLGGAFAPANGLCSLTDGTCSVAYTQKTAGDVTLTASYGGDANNLNSSGTVSITFTPSPTSMGMVCLPPRLTAGGPTVCTATVKGITTPTGSVTFGQTGGNGSFTPTTAACTLSGGSCSVSYEQNTVGATTIEGTYRGDANNLGSSSSVSVTFGKGSSATTIACTDSIAAGEASTCTATVTGLNPAGAVTFSRTGGTGAFSSQTCQLSSGSCSVAYVQKTAGVAMVVGAYGGDANNNASSGSAAITFGRASTTTGVTCKPSTFLTTGSTTCTATVAGVGPTGTTSWASSGAGMFNSTTCSLINGSCSVSFAKAASGMPSITATYGGDGNNLASSGSTAVTINPDYTLYYVGAAVAVVVVMVVVVFLLKRKRSPKS